MADGFTNTRKIAMMLLGLVFVLAGCGPATEQPTIKFSVSSPRVAEPSAHIVIAGSFNEWDPEAEGYALSKKSHYEFEITLDFDINEIGSFIEYKYVLLFEGTDEDPWTYVEGTSTGGETDNRRYQIKQGAQTVNDDIQTFKNHTGSNSVTRGTLQTITLEMMQYSDGRKRRIRVWLPDGYDPAETDKKYPVLYMHDGQNLFDSYTSYAGEWKIDESIGKMMDEGYDGAIVVGIDNSADRLNELSPTWPIGYSSYQNAFNDPSGEKYASFIVDTVKPYVDAHFNTDPGRASTGVGGSSMGGIISFFMALTHPEIFGYAIIFSPAMYIYQTNTLQNFLNDLDFADQAYWPRLYIYAGGMESSITPYVGIMKDELVDRGYDADRIGTYVDPKKDHNENAWAQYFPIAYRWLVGY
jgi:metallo-beta-lactamase class B